MARSVAESEYGSPFYCGHWLSKSRQYSTTFGAVRLVRRRWARLLAAALSGRPLGLDGDGGPLVLDEFGRPDGDERTLIVGQWRYVGRGRDPAGAEDAPGAGP
nr:replication initiator [Pseudofrankia sp. BMG5.37]